MNSYSRESVRRTIKPSARPNIHAYRTNIASTSSENMVRYGIPNTPSEQGHDEVDNIISKPLYPHSPTLSRNHRSNSLTLSSSKEKYLEDKILSKSLTETRSPYYSDSNTSSDEETLTQNRSNSFENGRNEYSQGRLRSNQNEFHNRYQNESHSRYRNESNNRYRNESNNRSQNESNNRSQNESIDVNRKTNSTREYGMYITGSAIVAVVIAIVFAYNSIYLTKGRSSDVENYDDIKFSTDLNELREKYKINHNSILQVQLGVAGIFDREDTGSFIFIYNSQNHNHDEDHFENLIHDMASISARYLRNESRHGPHTVLESKSLLMDTHSDLMSKYREEVDQSGVMLVKELDNVPSNLAMAFHYYCDEYNPLVKKSAIFFTLDLGKCPSNASQKSQSQTRHSVIEKCLANKWKTVPVDNIKPLLTRVVNIVVDVYSLF